LKILHGPQAAQFSTDIIIGAAIRRVNELLYIGVGYRLVMPSIDSPLGTFSSLVLK
jgi:hypothetical protein